MAPPRSKWPPPSEPGAEPEPQDDGELPFDEAELTPLRADDPAPQHVPQLPAGAQARRRRPALGLEDAVPTQADRALAPSLDLRDYSDPGSQVPCLYVERGAGAGQLLPVRNEILLIGRASCADLCLQHPSISRRHAQLRHEGGRLLLTDLRSQNGTFVNQTRVTGEAVVVPGDTIAVGNSVLRVRGPLVSEAVPPPGWVRSFMSDAAGRPHPGRIAALAGGIGAVSAVALTLVILGLVSTPSDHENAVVPQLQVGDAPGSEAGRAESDALARYNQGDLAGALAIAAQRELEPLGSRLRELQRAYTAGRSAAAAGDLAAGVRELGAALQMDHALSTGSVFSASLPRELAELHSRVGDGHFGRGELHLAREAYATALAYEPSHAHARARIERLAAPRGAPPRPHRGAVERGIGPSPDRAAAIEEAFEN